MSCDLDIPGECHEWARLLEAVTKQRDAAERMAQAQAHEIRELTAERDHARGERDFQLQCALKMQAERDTARAEAASARAERDAVAGSIAAHVSDRLDWDRSNDAALYAIADDIASGAWRTWERK